MSKTLAFGLLVVGCVAAAAGGAYLAVRQNAAVPPAALTAVAESPTATPTAPSTPVSDTEAVVAPKAEPQAEPAPLEAPARRAEQPRIRREPPRQQRVAAPPPTVRADASTPAPVEPERPVVAQPPSVPVTPIEQPPAEPQRSYEPPPPPEPQFEEVIVPASSVIGLQVTTTLSTERAQVEDKVEARVTRDVISAGRIAIPAGARVLGSVTVVERGGKVKDRARLGVRFHTLVLADGSQYALRTDGIFREGESPTGESARKIGGAAVGGAILGAIIGGGKGAAIGGATGAAGGTAAVMAGGRNAATLPSGTVVNVRLTSPLAVELRKEK
jgi:hypothetical protein